MRAIFIVLATFISFAVAAAPKDSVSVKLNTKRYYIQSHQYEIVDHNSNQGMVMKVVRYEDRTEVEVYQNIVYDSQWFTIESNFFIYDRNSKDKYMLHSTVGDIPTDQLCIVRGLNGKRIRIKLILPPLKPDIEKVDIISFNHPLTYVPTNGDGWNQYNLKVYQGEPQVKRASRRGRIIKMNDKSTKK